MATSFLKASERSSRGPAALEIPVLSAATEKPQYFCTFRPRMHPQPSLLNPAVLLRGRPPLHGRKRTAPAKEALHVRGVALQGAVALLHRDGKHVQLQVAHRLVGVEHRLEAPRRLPLPLRHLVER
jgi:hypothetical protein